MVVAVPWIALINPSASLTVTALGSSASVASAVVATLLSARLFALVSWLVNKFKVVVSTPSLAGTAANDVKWIAPAEFEFRRATALRTCRVASRLVFPELFSWPTGCAGAGVCTSWLVLDWFSDVDWSLVASTAAVEAGALLLAIAAGWLLADAWLWAALLALVADVDDWLAFAAVLLKVTADLSVKLLSSVLLAATWSLALAVSACATACPPP